MDAPYNQIMTKTHRARINKEQRARTPERWRPIPGCNFEISNWGRIRHRDSQHLTVLPLNNGGYPIFTHFGLATKKYTTVMVSKLMGQTWLAPQPFGKFLCRLDGDKSNLAVWNLRWMCQREISQHQYRIGTRVRGQHYRKMVRMSAGDHAIIKELFKAGQSQCAIARRFGITNGCVSKLVRGLARPSYKCEERMVTKGK